MKYQEIVEPAARRYGVPAFWVYAVIGTESGDVHTFTFNDVTVPTWEASVKEYSWGPMQILESTARSMGFTGNETELERPEISIPFAVKYLADLRRRFGTNFTRVYSAYNSGNPDRWMTSQQVAANVARAATWLKHFRPTPLLAGVVAVVVLVIGLKLQPKKRSKRKGR